MDAIDEKILTLLSQNARMAVKDIATKISLTAPAVSQRIHRLEKDGIIAGYTLRLAKCKDKQEVSAFIHIKSISSDEKEQFLQYLAQEQEVSSCSHVTGNHSFLLTACCQNMTALEELLSRLQKWGETETQMILSTPIERIS